MSKCPDCLTGELTYDKESKLDQCENRIVCGYGWYDKEDDNG
jgi:hypothetical protein